MNIYSRFKRWLALLLNLSLHEQAQDLQFKAIEGSL